jgi:hypothetical protein
MRYETLQDINKQEVFQLRDLPNAMAPTFIHKDNLKLNSGHYQLLKRFRNGSIVYAYNFIKTTPCSSATYENLELSSPSVSSIITVQETEIINELPPDATFHPFVISKRGIGEDLYLKAIASTAKKTAISVLERLKEKIPSLSMTTDMEEDIVKFNVGDAPADLAVRCFEQYVFVLHETDCTKQFFQYAQALYPKLNILSENINFSGQSYFTRYALSKEDSAIYELSLQSPPSAVLVKEIDEIDGYSGEGEPDARLAQLPKSECQLIANMTRTSAMVAMQAISTQHLFKKINVVGLLMDYDNNCVTKVLKMISDYVLGTTVLLSAMSSEKIDRMLARVHAQFNPTSLP